MDVQEVFENINEFSQTTHGSSDFHIDEVFVMADDCKSYAPLRHLDKKIENLEQSLIKYGFVYDSYELFDPKVFKEWYESQFSRKLKRAYAKRVLFLHLPDNKQIFDAIEEVNRSYEVLANQKVLINNKKLPVQLGEWYAKSIFGLQQRRSSSQRGFDFYLDGKRAEVKVHWGDVSSPKGVKVRKPLIDLSEYCITVYIAKNLMIREICFLDSSFVKRKLSGKGHTIFLKDSDIGSYFFSRSQQHFDKVICPSSLLKYSSPALAMKLAEHF